MKTASRKCWFRSPIWCSLVATKTLGTVTVELFDNSVVHMFEDRRVFGVIEESVNATPGVLDLPPHAAQGTAVVTIDVWLQAVAFSTDPPLDLTLHNDTRLVLASNISADPPVAGDSFTMQNADPIPVFNNEDNPFAATTIDFVILDLIDPVCETPTTTTTSATTTSTLAATTTTLPVR